MSSSAPIGSFASTAGHGFKVGDLLYSAWGYDQTNVDFYEVVRVSKASVWLRKRLAAITPGAGLSPMSGYSTAADGFASEVVFSRRVGFYGSVKIDSCSRAYRWHGEPVGCSWYA